jgi:hypothetical protein
VKFAPTFSGIGLSNERNGQFGIFGIAKCLNHRTNHPTVQHQVARAADVEF